MLVVCWLHQSDRRIWVCISLQSDCRIKVYILHQSYHSIWISCTNHSVRVSISHQSCHSFLANDVMYQGALHKE